MSGKNPFNKEEYLKKIVSDLLDLPEICELVNRLRADASKLGDVISQNLVSDVVKDAVVDSNTLANQGVVEKDKSVGADAKEKNRLRARYHYCKKKGMPIDDALSAELVKNFPGYNPKTQEFVGTRGKGVAKASKYKVAKKESGAEKLNEALDVSEIKVEVKPVSVALEGTYNNVYINGVKFLSNHLNTQIEFLYDNTLMAIRGVVTDCQDLPKKPIFQLYDAKLQQHPVLCKQKFNDYRVYVEELGAQDDRLRVKLSNRAITYIKESDIRRIAGRIRFVMADTQKSK
ncbi:MAG: hypothetical protein J6K82_03075 [Alphaproteobacteria bacterium]|nr:hypothetical protein [Alphaproteobacteria bacterium]